MRSGIAPILVSCSIKFALILVQLGTTPILVSLIRFIAFVLILVRLLIELALILVRLLV